jgi:hypothetical protein
MEQIQEILSAPQSSSGATSLMKLYQQATGNKLQVGCLCKSTNVNKVYTQVQDWYTSQQN